MKCYAISECIGSYVELYVCSCASVKKSGLSCTVPGARALILFSIIHAIHVLQLLQYFAV